MTAFGRVTPVGHFSTGRTIQNSRRNARPTGQVPYRPEGPSNAPVCLGTKEKMKRFKAATTLCCTALVAAILSPGAALAANVAGNRL
jgi:hypothetical protein